MTPPPKAKGKLRDAVRYFFLPLCVFLGGNFFVYYALNSGRLYFFNAVGVSYLFSTLLFPFYLLGVALLPAITWKPFAVQRFRAPQSVLVTVAILLLGIRWYATHYEPHHLTIHEITLRSEKIQNPIELLHLSDIQSAALGRYEEEVFKTIQRLDPDLVIHTGDLLQPVPPATWESEFPKIQRLFDSIAPRFGILNIYGNCEMHLTGFLEDHLAGVETLDGRNIRLDIGETKLRIHGLRFNESEVDASSVAKKLIDMSGTDEFVILLGHSPNFILSILDHPIDLCLAGHTHGGQIRIPGVGSLLTFSSLPKEWASGFHEVDQTRFNVSAGIGTEGTEWLPPIRLFCPPEMTLIHLIPSE